MNSCSLCKKLLFTVEPTTRTAPLYEVFWLCIYIDSGEVSNMWAFKELKVTH